MRDLEKLRVKSKVIDIEGMEFKITGLSFPELAKFANIVDKDSTENAVSYLLKKALRKATSKEEIVDGQPFDDFVNGLSSDVAVKIINTVKEVSGLDTESKEEKKLVGV